MSERASTGVNDEIGICSQDALGIGRHDGAVTPCGFVHVAEALLVSALADADDSLGRHHGVKELVRRPRLRNDASRRSIDGHAHAVCADRLSRIRQRLCANACVAITGKGTFRRSHHRARCGTVHDHAGTRQNHDERSQSTVTPYAVSGCHWRYQARDQRLPVLPVSARSEPLTPAACSSLRPISHNRSDRRFRYATIVG